MGAACEWARAHPSSHPEATRPKASLLAVEDRYAGLIPAARSTRQTVSCMSASLHARPTGGSKDMLRSAAPKSRRCTHLGPAHSQKIIRVQMNECVRCWGQCVPDFVARVEYMLSACAETYPVKGCNAQAPSSWLGPSEMLP